MHDFDPVKKLIASEIIKELEDIQGQIFLKADECILFDSYIANMYWLFTPKSEISSTIVTLENLTPKGNSVKINTYCHEQPTSKRDGSYL